MTDADDLEALRARLRELEGQLSARSSSVDVTTQPGHDREWWRSVVVATLATVAAVLAPLTVVATWAHDQIGDTTRFQQTVEPLAADPAVQHALVDRITREINGYIDVKGITQDTLTALSGQSFVPSKAAGVLPSLAVPLSRASEEFVHTRVDRVVRSEKFQRAWVEAMRLAHTQMVAVLTGSTSDAVDISNGAVKINIAPFVASVKQILIDDGFSFATRIPEVSASFTVFQAEHIGTAQKFFGWLDTLARILPILTLLLLFAAVMVARNRRKALLMVGLAVAGSMVVLGLALNLIRPVYLDAVPADVLPGDAAAAIYDQLVSFIRTSLRAVGVVFLAIALAAFWFAPTGAGAAVRSGAATGLRRARNRSGVNTGPVGQFLGTYRTFTRVTVVGIGTLFYLALDHPTAREAFTIMLLIVLALVVLEFLAGPTARDADAVEGRDRTPVPGG